MIKTVKSFSKETDQSRQQEDEIRWINGPWVDFFMAFSWIPFAAFALLIENTPGALVHYMFAVFVFSFTHQPLTMALVYGDPERFSWRRRLFTWSPFIFIGAAVIGLTVVPIILAIVAGLWNAEHTLMQRYGITRIYGRMCGQNHGGVELSMLFSWLILAGVCAAANPLTLSDVDTLGMSGSNRTAFQLLTNLANYAEVLVPFMYLIGTGLFVFWVFQESRRRRNRCKHLYILSTGLLFILILVHPIAGYIGYVGAHAYEYFVIVNRSLGRYMDPSVAGVMGNTVRKPHGRWRFFAFYVFAIGGTLFFLETAASNFFYSVVFFTVGALHFFYDSFIWKLRDPAVARSLGAVSS